jgi:ribonuclease Z
MSWLVQTRLINGPFDDPGLFIDFRFGRRAVLFDLGDLSVLSPRELMRVSHAFVSHTHLDHFIGFDRLLRVRLHQTAPLHLFGPTGLADHVAAKLAGYAWNLLDERSPDFVITASEFSDERIVRRCAFRARTRFAREELEPPELPPGLVHAEDEFSVEATILDHGIPCLAFALQETLRVNVLKDRLKALGLPVGPWLNATKRAVRAGADDGTRVEVPGGTMPLGKLKESALRISAGQRIAYVTDAAGTGANLEKIAALAKGADQLFIEAAFLAADCDLAELRRHLTAAAAGAIARRAGAKRVIPFHFSNRYEEREAEVRREVDEAFSSPAG